MLLEMTVGSVSKGSLSRRPSILVSSRPRVSFNRVVQSVAADLHHIFASSELALHEFHIATLFLRL
jgi:hypothetical protein